MRLSRVIELFHDETDLSGCEVEVECYQVLGSWFDIEGADVAEYGGEDPETLESGDATDGLCTKQHGSILNEFLQEHFPKTPRESITDVDFVKCVLDRMLDSTRKELRNDAEALEFLFARIIMDGVLAKQKKPMRYFWDNNGKWIPKPPPTPIRDNVAILEVFEQYGLFSRKTSKFGKFFLAKAYAKTCEYGQMYDRYDDDTSKHTVFRRDRAVVKWLIDGGVDPRYKIFFEVDTYDSDATEPDEPVEVLDPDDTDYDDEPDKLAGDPTAVQPPAKRICV